MENTFTIPQSPLIKDIVHIFWQNDLHSPSAVKETILPKGLVEIVFKFDTARSYATFNDNIQVIPACFIQGFHNRPFQLFIEEGQFSFGVVLSPCAVKHIFHFPANILVNRIIDLTLVDPTIRALWQLMGEQTSFDDRVNVFAAWLMKRLPPLTDRDKAFNQFLLSHSNSNLSVAELARHFCYSTKQLSRKLNELTGQNAEQVILFKKFLQATQLVHSSDLSLTEIAYESHFCDQSHFIRTFKAFSNITPKEYKQKKGIVSGHIYEDVPYIQF
jgi:AraC-like DNA-binding protein